MDKQKRLARNAWIGSGEKIIEQVWIDLANNLDPTEFLGYYSLNSQAKILAIVIDGNVADKIEPLMKEQLALLFDKTASIIPQHNGEIKQSIQQSMELLSNSLTYSHSHKFT